ncbi:outer membrane beta-barrel protein [Neolewinella agarilytica]|uniref:outer membrane beta-barrel protein n=1 Tax=Neolewinella agarilytica TaxID=478744 RepID=UPI001FDF8E1C|nr:outer membrane beta-barrel protein [Neolewinella agarilytica]
MTEHAAAQLGDSQIVWKSDSQTVAAAVAGHAAAQLEISQAVWKSNSQTVATVGNRHAAAQLGDSQIIWKSDSQTVAAAVAGHAISRRPLLLLALLLSALSPLLAQNTLTGQLQNAEAEPVAYANVALYADSNLVKVETTDDAGLFRIREVADGPYVLIATYLGAPDLVKNLAVNGDLDLGILTMAPAAVELDAATVTARRAIVEIKPDRTVFNVQGTINAVGENGLDLLRKAPGVTIDNNDNINVLSRSGVLVYVDGKRLPLGGAELAAYLRSLTAEQIDRIDIITNPGAKYEAQGNAGILDIRLVKNENEGANGTANYTISQGRYQKMNGSVGGNYRNKRLNVFGQVGSMDGRQFSQIDFLTFQNGLQTLEDTRNFFTWNHVNGRFGTDFFLSDKHTLGFLVDAQTQHGIQTNRSDIEIAGIDQPVDSILLARSRSDDDQDRATFNLNYRYEAGKGKSLNVDLDYGRFRNRAFRRQPNVYFAPDRLTELSEITNNFDTPTDIDIYTFKIDYEQALGTGKLGTGIKLSQVGTDNSFRLFNVVGGNETFDVNQSNLFTYDENVYAAYLSYAGSISDRMSYSAGLRAEITDATGILTAFNGQSEPPVDLNYVSLFPTAGLTYQLDQQKGNSLALNYGRRINRPDYNVLNPFRIQVSQLSFELGNPTLNPEIVDNLELGYTLAYRYNFKVAYSKTSDQITRLIGPDPVDPRAGFISWDNLAENTVISFNAALPFTVTPKWDAFFNLSASHINNQADYGDGAVIDLQAFSYNIFTQHTFKLPWKLTGEIGGFFAGPGIWGGVFEYDESWSFNLGLQRKFLNDQLNIKLAGSDLFYQVGWSGETNFNGQQGFGAGNYDSRRVALSLSYAFGNQKIKARTRDTGLGEEARRVN